MEMTCQDNLCFDFLNAPMFCVDLVLSSSKINLSVCLEGCHIWTAWHKNVEMFLSLDEAHRLLRKSEREGIKR